MGNYPRKIAVFDTDGCIGQKCEVGITVIVQFNRRLKSLENARVALGQWRKSWGVVISRNIFET
jgi:hypothetical protein